MSTNAMLRFYYQPSETQDFYQYFLLFCLSIIIINHLWKKRDPLSPGGPDGIPFLGVLLSLRSYPERVLAQWNKKYGPIYMAKFGFTDVVVIGSPEIAHEAFVKNNCFNGRPTSIPAFDGHGIVMNNNTEIHKKLRQFGFKVFRFLGVKRSSFESHLLDISRQLCSDIDQLISRNEQSEPIDIDTIISKLSSDVISNLVFGHNVLEKNEKLPRLIKITHKSEATADLAGVIMFVPILRHLPVFRKVWKDGIIFRQKFEAEIEREIKEHDINRDANCPRDFIDYFLNQIDKEKPINKNNATLPSPYTREQLIGSARDLFLAGDHTSSSSLLWIVLYLSKYTDVQEKMQREIDQAMGSNVLNMSLRDLLPYTQAVIHEIARIRPVVPLSMPHLATDDGYLKGYKIRKGTILLTNIWAMNHDENRFPNPEKFFPERHLDQNGKFYKNSNQLTFSIGGRSCLGRQLAVLELLVTTVTLFQRFKFRLPAGIEPDMRGKSTISLRPKNFNVVISRR